MNPLNCLLVFASLAKLFHRLGTHFERALHNLRLQAKSKRVVLSYDDCPFFTRLHNYRVTITFVWLHQTQSIELCVVDDFSKLGFFLIIDYVDVAITFLGHAEVLFHVRGALICKSGYLLLWLCKLLLCTACHKLSQ